MYNHTMYNHYQTKSGSVKDLIFNIMLLLDFRLIKFPYYTFHVVLVQPQRIQPYKTFTISKSIHILQVI